MCYAQQLLTTFSGYAVPSHDVCLFELTRVLRWSTAGIKEDGRLRIARRFAALGAYAGLDDLISKSALNVFRSWPQRLISLSLLPFLL